MQRMVTLGEFHVISVNSITKTYEIINIYICCAYDCKCAIKSRQRV